VQRVRTRIALLIAAAALGVWTCACGGGPRTQNADVLALHQPTPDPTLDAVVRDLPRALAGVAPTPTPVPKPVPPTAKPVQRQQPVAPAKPTPARH
jgi:hypothetical protein